MDIKDERRNERNHFEELFPGDVFEFDDKTFMKTDRIEFGTDEDDFYNAVSLVDGTFFSFMLEEQVTPLVVQLHIIRNG